VHSDGRANGPEAQQETLACDLRPLPAGRNFSSAQLGASLLPGWGRLEWARSYSNTASINRQAWCCKPRQGSGPRNGPGELLLHLLTAVLHRRSPGWQKKQSYTATPKQGTLLLFGRLFGSWIRSGVRPSFSRGFRRGRRRSRAHHSAAFGHVHHAGIQRMDRLGDIAFWQTRL